MSFGDDLLAISQYARQLRAEDLARPPVACPNDGEPLRTGPQGQLWCPFDGWVSTDGVDYRDGGW
jgi:hypothetical protein